MTVRGEASCFYALVTVSRSGLVEERSISAAPMRKGLFTSADAHLHRRHCAVTVKVFQYYV